MIVPYDKGADMNGTILRFVHEKRIHRHIGCSSGCSSRPKAGDQGWIRLSRSEFRPARHSARGHFLELAADMTVEVEFVVTEPKRTFYWRSLKKERISIFYARVPAQFGTIEGADRMVSYSTGYRRHVVRLGLTSISTTEQPMPNAIRIHQTGGPEVLQWESVTVGEPGPGEARVRHTAVGLNYIDTYHRSGLYKLPLPSGIGLEAAGVVEAVGPGVTDIAKGDRIAYCGGPPGSYAEGQAGRQIGEIARRRPDRSAATLMLKASRSNICFRQTFR
jgi:hypothetical protein